MRITDISRLFSSLRLLCAVLLTLPILNACKQDDPKPVNEEEVITTVAVTLVPQGGGEVVTLTFFDADGEIGSTPPVVTVSGNLQVSTRYQGEINLRNETVNPPVDITEEILEEAGDHLFCFSIDGPLTIAYGDEDEKGLPIGLSTAWETSDAGTVAVTVSLRHQAGTKTGQCPGAGETDVEVTFELEVQ